MMRVALVDSGGANIGSVRYALDRLGVDAVVTADAEAIRASERVILPGVGAADVA
ncbi:MAG TPA: imidazole glycerol phosphate synthase subunit HisH, partial [Chiayiivirga sp.]|nr:imidazole glycerol phosphate synthase subunit HisH [Chiayiivirga sp.]